GVQVIRYSTKLLSEGEVEILKRFSKVFEQAFTRFLDLQKAEAQAREANIEAALEKVRSRSLAMHKSDELTEVVAILFEKLKELQIHATAVGIAIHIDGSKDLNAFVCGENEAGLVITNYRLPYFNNKIPKDLSNALEKQLDFFVGNYSKEEKNSFYKYVFEHTDEFRHLPEDMKRMIFESPVYNISMVAVKNAVFNINDFEGKVLSKNEVEVIKRFARVFDQSYTRFLDLQKAEAQAREAQIEASLERVRSRALAMHKTDELLDAAELLYKEITGLGITSMNVSYAFVDVEKKYDSYYGINPVDGKIPPFPFVFPHTETVMRSILSSWKKQETFHVVKLDREATLKHQTWVGEHMQATFAENKIPFSVEAFLEVSPQTAMIYTFNFVQGYLFLVGETSLTTQEEEMLLRFTKVFEMTYRRFLDLKQAEAQAREAQIELGLERVRARAMAMQKSDELAELVDTVFKELTKLDFALSWCMINIVDESTMSNMVWGANPEIGKPPESYHMLFEDYRFHHEMFKAWKEKQAKWVFVLKGAEKEIYDEYLFNQTEFRRVPELVQK
ncbi:MAG: hypothetical protein M3Q73_04455, partial [bacterium]|nr:hypothetical protein [bacterium]